MAIKISGTTVIDDSRNIQNVGVVTATTFSGNITGTAATFTGNVSIAGTLTYDDVTNVDSVGLITARSGVKVTAGGVDITAGGLNVTAGVSTLGTVRVTSGIITATAGVVTYYGDGSYLTGVAAAGAGGGASDITGNLFF